MTAIRKQTYIKGRGWIIDIAISALLGEGIRYRPMQTARGVIGVDTESAVIVAKRYVYQDSLSMDDRLVEKAIRERKRVIFLIAAENSPCEWYILHPSVFRSYGTPNLRWDEPFANVSVRYSRRCQSLVEAYTVDLPNSPMIEPSPPSAFVSYADRSQPREKDDDQQLSLP